MSEIYIKVLSGLYFHAYKTDDLWIETGLKTDDCYLWTEI